MRKIRGFLIDVKNPINTGVKEIEDKLDEYYKILNCDSIEIAIRKIGNRIYNIVCDEEGLLKGNQMYSYVKFTKDDKIEDMLVGNIFIVNYDGKEDLTSLLDTDIPIIRSCLGITTDDKGSYLTLLVHEEGDK